jgi:hypothetical protein
MRRALLPEGHWKTAEARGLLGECLASQQRYEEAEPLLLGSRAALDGAGRSREGAAALRRLIELYDNWDKPIQARRYRDLLAGLSD